MSAQEKLQALYDDVRQLVGDARGECDMGPRMLGRTAARRQYKRATDANAKAAAKLLKINRLIAEICP